MKVQVLQKDLQKSTNLASRFISTRSQLPILNNFLILAEKTKLKVIATNLEMSIACAIGAKVDEEGKTTIPAKTFTEIVSGINPGEITLNENNEKLKITSENFTANISSTVANDYPSVPQTMKNKISLESKKFSKALSKTLFAVATDESRPVLTGVLILSDENKISVIASDGFRLSQTFFQVTKKVEKNFSVIIPRAPLIEISKELQTGENLSFEVVEKDNQVLFELGDIVVASRIIEGSFPDFEKIIPKTLTIFVDISKEDLNRGVKLASVFTKGESGIVKFTVKPDFLEISSEGANIGNQKSEIEAKVSGGELEIFFNFKFIQDFLNTVEGESVQIALTDGTSPAIFKDPKDEDFLHLIMPAKVQG